MHSINILKKGLKLNEEYMMTCASLTIGVTLFY